MDTISRFIVTSIVLLQALAILRGQNDLAVVAQGRYYELRHAHVCNGSYTSALGCTWVASYMIDTQL